jgi:phosphohistidine phosphatase
LESKDNKKILLILRHAKSSWKNNDIPDHDRPLNKRGKNQGSKMGKLLKKLDLVPDHIISSTAKRAIDTSELIAKFSTYDGAINQYSSLYNQSSAEHYIKILTGISNNYHKVLIIGHNPAIENLIEQLTNRIELMKTCSLARIDIKIKNWKDISNGIYKSDLINIWHPSSKNEID